MIVSFITRGLQLVFGYVYPAYECYKTVELNKPDVDQLRFWCQYWILAAGLTVCERFGDAFIDWVPMYGEAKLAFFIYLWFPKTKGTTYVYNSFFRPYVAKHETEIDRNLLELKTRAGDMASSYWQRVASYGQTRVFEILQYIASQSTPAHPSQPKKVSAKQLKDGQSSFPVSRTYSTEQQEDKTEGTPSEDSKAATNELKTTPTQSILENGKAAATIEAQAMYIDAVPRAANESTQSPQLDTVMDEAVRVTRARSRRTRTAAAAAAAAVPAADCGAGNSNPNA